MKIYLRNGRRSLIVVILAVSMLLTMISSAAASTYAVTITRTTSDFNLTYDTNWSDNSFQVLKEFAEYCPFEPSLMLAGLVYVCFDDNIITDKDFLKAEPIVNGMLDHQYGELFVMNNGNTSGWTSDFSYYSGAQTSKVSHSSDSVNYKVYFRYEE